MNVSAKQAGEMVKEGWILLDVRPVEEIARVRTIQAQAGAAWHVWLEMH